MIITSEMLVEKYNMYADPYGKIRRMCKAGELFPLTKGLYETEKNTSGYLLASALYGPSYLSFHYALARYGFIPESVKEYTSATCLKGKKKYFDNAFGSYSYRDVPADVFAFEVKLIEENCYAYFMATPEKALCDLLYSLPTIKNQQELKQLLFDNLRIDEDEFSKLNNDVILNLSHLYHSKNVTLLAKIVKR